LARATEPRDEILANPPSPFLRFASSVADLSGRPIAFIAAMSGIVIWCLSGPMFDFDSSWQLIVNTTTTIITFLMMFVLQNTQSRERRALHAKLDELILAGKADNRFIGTENLDADHLADVAEVLIAKAGTRADESPLEDPPAPDHQMSVGST